MEAITQSDYLAAGIRTFEAAQEYEDKTRQALERLSAEYFRRAVRLGRGGTNRAPHAFGADRIAGA